MNLPPWVTTGTAAVSAVVIGVSMPGCTSKEAKPSDTAKTAPAEVTVDATDTACTLSADKATAGPTTFVVTNNGTKVTEFYVYGKDDRVLGEVENVSPGLQRKLVVELDEPGTYKVACKPGMVGDGIRADFTVTGASAQGSKG